MADEPVNEPEDEEEQTETPESYNWKQTDQAMEGYFDYKNLMINPATSHEFPVLNRDLQLGNLSDKDYKVVFGHMHLAMDLNRFKVLEKAADFIFRRGWAHLIMSNSKAGFVRKLEATSIREIRKPKEDEKEGHWLKWRR